jgi:hypothetical protein
MHRALFKENSYRAITRSNLQRQDVWERLSVDQREIIRVVSRILPFRTNRYVTSQLIDWSQHSGRSISSLKGDLSLWLSRLSLDQEIAETTWAGALRITLDL